MAAFPCWTMLTVGVVASALRDLNHLKSNPGDVVTLRCQGPSDADISFLMWSRDDDCVFFYRTGRSYKNYQHLSYQGRVELRDADMKYGDGSVVLKNVTINDTGTYKCRVGMSNTGSTEPEVIDVIFLTVSEPGENRQEEKSKLTEQQQRDEFNLNFVALVGVLIIGLVAIVFMKYVLCPEENLPDFSFSVDEAEEQHLFES